MRQLGSIGLCLLVFFLAGCPKRLPFLASPDGNSDVSSTNPTPTASASVGLTASPIPETFPSPFTLPMNSLAMTVKPVALPLSGEASIPFEASEAILALTRTGEVPSTFGFAFDGATATTTGMPRLQSLTQAPGPACGTFDHAIPSMGALSTSPGIRAARAAFEPPVVGARRDFFVRSVAVTAVCVAVGTHGAIWVDQRDQLSFHPTALAGLLTDFDRLMPAITAQYGAGPAGRSDGYNWGDDHLNVLISQQVPQEYGGFVEPLDFFSDAFAQDKYHSRSNNAKLVYLNSIYGSSHFLGTMVHEYVHIVYYAHRLEAYSKHHALGLPLGQDSSYFGPPDQSERWLNEGVAVLGEYLFAPPAESTYRSYLQRYLDNPSAYDMEDFLRAAEQDAPNYGGALLFSAYAHARYPAFAREIQLAEGVSAQAVDEVMRQAIRQTFPEFYRDYALSLLLDGYHPDVPGQYRIPYVDVFGSFNGAQMESVTSSTVPPRSNGVRYVHVRFESGRGALRVRNAGAMKATLLLVKPATSADFNTN